MVGYGLFWELSRQAQESTGSDDALKSGRLGDQAQYQVQQLAERVDKLTIINMALWKMIQKISDYKEEDLLEMVKEIDLSDGQLDGKVRKGVLNCEQCGRVMSNKHSRCMYCGHQTSSEHGVFGNVLE